MYRKLLLLSLDGKIQYPFYIKKEVIIKYKKQCKVPGFDDYFEIEYEPNPIIPFAETLYRIYMGDSKDLLNTKYIVITDDTLVKTIPEDGVLI